MRHGLSCSEVAFSDFRGRLQHIHPEEPLKKMGPLSGMVRSLRRGLNRATLGVLVIDEDRCPCVKLLPDLEDFCRQWDVLDAVVGPFAGHERFDDPAQGFRTEHMVRNPHPGGSQQAFLTGFAHLYNLAPYQRWAQQAGQCGVEVEDGHVPTPDWMLNLHILPSGGCR